MHWLQSLDISLFRFVNSTLQNSAFDALMPFASGNVFSFVLLALVLIGLLVKGNLRARLMLLMLAVILPLGDSYVCNTIKHATLRLRPFAALDGVHQLVVAGRDNSMPSSHSANWAAAAMIVFIYFGRRSLWFMLPLAFTVSFSRIYNGVHFPSDVLAGWILGAGYAAAGVWSLDKLWQSAGKKYFQGVWETCPSLINLNYSTKYKTIFTKSVDGSAEARRVQLVSWGIDFDWLRCGYFFIFATLAARLAFLASGTLELTEDETYYWLWSKHLALSYFSKPPLIADTIWLGTQLFSDTIFGVRFFPPVIAAAMSWLVLRFFAREVNARAGFFLLLAITTTPLLAVGATLMTIDPLSVLFWTAAMIAGWRAVQEKSTTRDWLWVGLWMGLGFLSKYTALFQLLCWATFFILWKPARAQLCRPGPWFALLINALCSLPVLIWNSQRGWITVHHVASDAHAGDTWKFTLHEFLANEFALLNPVFFVLLVWAAITFWRNAKKTTLQIYLFAMGAPLFLVYALWSCHSRVMPNWIAPSVLPLFCLAVTFWDGRSIKRWLAAGLILGGIAVALMHQPATLQKILQRPLPREISRTVAWRASGDILREARRKFLAEGKPVFLIGNHYGITSQMAFQLRRDGADCFFLTSREPKNQFYFWPDYTNRTGENALFIQLLGSPTPQDPPAQLAAEFETVTAAGVFPVNYYGQPVRWLQLFECRNLH